MWITRLKFREALDKADHAGYDRGITKGYQLGYSAGQAESRNRGYILGGRNYSALEDAERILREVQGK